MIDKHRLITEARALGIDAEQACADKLDAFCELLVEANKCVNLTAITQPRQIEVKHLLDSLFAAAQPEVRGEVADIGCGAGFPGVVIAALKAECRVTLVDATNKKLVFARSACDSANIRADTVHGRAEELAHLGQYRESFDCVTARAVANLTVLSEYCLPFLKIGGAFIAMKGPEADNEIDGARATIKALGGELDSVRRCTLPDSSERSLIIIKKISQSPPKYPRPSKDIAKGAIK
ncbi:MAG: 16S rRNA (guanine(527)-N(7))-methyltransferase RsmG [Oscillospiraceae bacterium]